MNKQNDSNKILIVGLFLSDSNKHTILRTPADQLAETLGKHGYGIIKTSVHVPRLKRLIDTVFTIIKNKGQFSIAIVPFYGGFRSFVWETITVALLKKLNKKIVLIVHGGAIPERMKTKSAKYIRTMSKADVLVCPSAYLMNELEQYGLQTKLVENIVNLSEYQFHERAVIHPRILWMRTFEDVYNPLMAIRVLAMLMKEFPEASMVMAGHDRGMLQETIDYAKELGVLNRIEFPGYISNAQKNELAAACSIYICTNMVDNAPISLIEMMALGLPIVSVNTGGIPFLVKDKYDCLLVNNNDGQAMVEKIIYLISNPQEAVKLALNGKLSAERFDELPVVQKWENIFKKLSN